MCRLLGIVGNPPLPAAEILSAFRPLSETEPSRPGSTLGRRDGWGVAGYSQGRMVYFERSIVPPADVKSQLDVAAAKAQRSLTPVLLAHLGQTSVKDRSLANTHPFFHRNWTFAHHGTIFNESDLELSETQPLGTTDSERFMLWLLENVGSAPNLTEALTEFLPQQRQNLNYSSLTFLLSDGEFLWAYRDLSPDHLQAGETWLDRESTFRLYSGQSGEWGLVSSEPLNAVAAKWTLLPNQTLAVFEVANPLPQLVDLSRP